MMLRILIAGLLVLGLPAISHATTKWIESGTDATQDFNHYASAVSGATVTSSTTNPHTGPRSIRAVSTAGGVAAYFQHFITGYTATNGQMSAYYYVTDLPTAELSIFSLLKADATSVVLHIRITSGGVLQLWSNTAQVGSNGATLATGTWYRLSLAWTITDTSTNEFRLFVDGVQTITLTNVTLGFVPDSATRVRWGWGSSSVGNSKTIDIDDLIWTDASTLADTGDLRVTAKLPVSNNVNTFDTAIGANPANRWENVNERPLSNTNGWNMAGTTLTRENFGIQSLSVGDVDLTGATLVTRSGWIWAKSNTTTSAAAITDNGADTAVDLVGTGTGRMFTVVTDTGTYPSDAAVIGMKSTNTTADSLLYECGVLFAYTPAVATLMQGGGRKGPPPGL